MPDETWSEKIIDYADDASHRGPLPLATHIGHATNPTCGDWSAAHLFVHAGHIEKIAIEARGCCVSRAAAAMLAAELEGMPAEQGRLMTDAEMFKLVGVGEASPRRMCVLLPLAAVRQALRGERPGGQSCGRAA